MGCGFAWKARVPQPAFRRQQDTEFLLRFDALRAPLRFYRYALTGSKQDYIVKGSKERIKQKKTRMKSLLLYEGMYRNETGKAKSLM